MIEGIASSLGIKNDVPNVELAIRIAGEKDSAKTAEIAEGLQSDDPAVSGDCIKVLYEVGYREPELLDPYTATFISLLGSRNNRLVWGAMNALSLVAARNAGLVFRHLDKIKKAYEKGSVITVDCAISVFASLAKAGPQYEKTIFPLLLRHLKSCRPKQIAQHAERASVCIHSKNVREFLNVLQERSSDLSESQAKRISKLTVSLPTPVKE
ncbi:MAG: hypothetical protein JW874_07660 [Spirochaetales bacterium]|nr:hypothetical protein [Spirochaetales bacterium]